MSPLSPVKQEGLVQSRLEKSAPVGRGARTGKVRKMSGRQLL